MRHADAELKSPGQDDFNRVISRAGIAELYSMRVAFNKYMKKVDFVCCSSAVRTRQTVEQIKEFFKKGTHISYDDGLYNTTKNGLWKKLNSVDEKFQNILIVSHNPALSYFVEEIDNSRLGIFSSSTMAVMATTEVYSNAYPGSLTIEEIISPNPQLHQ